MIGRQFCDNHRLARRNAVEVQRRAAACVGLDVSQALSGWGKPRLPQGIELADFKSRKAMPCCC